MAATRFVQWFRENARVLPWRRSPRDPYHVLVSEFMLQQTQMDRVVPRFESFVRRFPTLEILASASEDEVVEEWSGLGYYRRARWLHQAARTAVSLGGIPDTAAGLQELPGVGPYTAAAVASMAFGEAAPVLDGNTLRVGARVLGLEGEPRTASGRRRVADWMLDQMTCARPGEVNEAVMELGAIVCTPSEPSCGQCPFEDACKARAWGRQSEIPPPRRRRKPVAVRWVAACIVDQRGRWLLKRIESGSILRGLWLPPLSELAPGEMPLPVAARDLPFEALSPPIPAPPVRHHITHRKIDVIPVRIEVAGLAPPSEEWRWVDPEEPGVPTSSLLQKLVSALGP